LVKDAYPFLITLGVGALISLLLAIAGESWWYWPAGILGLQMAFVAWFFRNPDREVPGGDETVVSPADGLVVVVRKVDLGEIAEYSTWTTGEVEGQALTGEGTQVSIFLSVFDVHVNRSPIGGRIIRSEYRPGKFLVASLERATQENEQQIVTVRNSELTVVFRLIAGLIARRIVTWKNQGEMIARGERIGLIKFGSRVDIILPPNVEVVVRRGQRVKGGSSVIGKVVR
jgi:phosphatidylserine decarboxylase